ncbi:G2E3 [Cordylochernes scorpioides]|uniref:G2E3 n=1 Tax=Cordylochernes scorpioides TaxID=51811 RepID=A0ABY6KWG2_9ARAC|nr:G2E3 [Cordylochernes scorpioides]
MVVQGTAPLPRAAHAAAILRGHLVFVFGGRHQLRRTNDLYCLDMETLKWSGNLTKEEDNEPVPQGRSWHTLTPLGQDYLVLYGGFNQRNEPLSDCWWFDINKRKWRQIHTVPCDKPRLWHTAILTPFQEIIICGGCTENILDHSIVADHKTSDIIVLRFSPKSLYRLCLDYLAHHLESLNDINELPHNIQSVLLRRVSNTTGHHTTLGGS